MYKIGGHLQALLRGRSIVLRLSLAFERATSYNFVQYLTAWMRLVWVCFLSWSWDQASSSGQEKANLEERMNDEWWDATTPPDSSLLPSWTVVPECKTLNPIFHPHAVCMGKKNPAASRQTRVYGTYSETFGSPIDMQGLRWDVKKGQGSAKSQWEELL